ncbi:pheromone-binding protein-related protein 6-like [Leptinotarsa decemlineata]|uniref:pheromone-binding protein-related protein 6-like n=1 Tax=Leptinotarsa decemlineata TaxID=7539 RepID=UPI003D30ACBE
MNNITLPLLALLFYSAYAYLDPKDFGEELTKAANEWHDICTDITGATDDMIKQVRSGNFIEDEKMKRYLLCLWRVSRVADKNLKVDVEAIRQVLPQMLKKETPVKARDCLVNARNSDLKENYDKIYEVEKCLYNLDPEQFIMF